MAATPTPTRPRAAARARPRRADPRLGFEALWIEGGLLAPEWLARVARLDAGGQGEADYRVPRGLNLRDEIGRYWRIAQAHWSDLAAGRAAGAQAGALAERFVTGLLRDAFGFASLGASDPVVLSERAFPLGHAAQGGRVPVAIAPWDAGLDAPSAAFGDGGRRRSAFGLLQEYLNAAEQATWGLASDGRTLRIARDNNSLTRPAWIEADLERIFAEERYADFAALWLLAHESRFGREGAPGTECALETWRSAGHEEGTRAREHLRRGVEEALVALGQGFVAHPGNGGLRAALQDGSLRDRDLFNQLLRLVYRLIFLLTVEERDLLHPPGTPAAVRELYAEGYGLRRLRERSARRGAHDRHSDAWEAAKVVFRGLAGGEPRLGLPALGGLFAAGQCPDLDAARLENRALMLAVYRLSWFRDAAGLARVNWRDMGPEELGSVYESLLELVPSVSVAARNFAFATGDETRGNARKTSGSYYTPDGLVQVLLESALEPVVAGAIAAHPEDPVEALLSLSVVDPACGSGHFLLAAARRLAAHVARLQANGTPTAAEYRHALRQVVGRCIYGVDLNPMAVELCKVALWMEAVEPGLPLTFLDAHVQHGNALLGTTPARMAEGIPDEAWSPIEGDDRKVASALKRRNREEARGQLSLRSLWSKPAGAELAELTRAMEALDAAPDADAGALAAKEERWAEIRASAAWRHQRLVADAWCAAFVWPKQAGPLADAAPTAGLWWALRAGQGHPPALTVETVEALAERYRFFHWHLAFPTVFERGGFDVVLGNPPWERVKLQEQEFFASRSEEIAKAPNAAVRKGLIAELEEAAEDGDRSLWKAWKEAVREADGQSHLVRQSGRYPLCGKGDVNTYALFAEHNRAVLGPRGRAGFIVPSGLVTDDTTKEFFQSLVDSGDLAAVLHFENEEKVFSEVHHAFRFLLICLDRAGTSVESDLLFYARRVSDLNDAARHFTLSPAEFVALNPNTRTCPTFRSRRDAMLNIAMYGRSGVLVQDASDMGNPWEISIRTRIWHMAEDSEWFRTAESLESQGYVRLQTSYQGQGVSFSPLLEAKMVHQFDHRYGTYDGQTAAQESQGKLPELDDDAHARAVKFTLPYYWVPRAEVEARLDGVWDRGWLLGWRDITGAEKQRTVIASIVPRVAVGHTLPLLFTRVDPRRAAALYANLCSFALDYAARQKIGGTHLTYSYLKQLPILPPSVYRSTTPWHPDTPLVDWLLPRVLELTYTAWDLQPFARDVGYDGPPFRWDPERRALLRAELDAAYFHLYGISRDDTGYVLDTFPIVRRNDEKAHGEYRTKRVVLEVYDALADAARTGVPYTPRLDPPPADPRVAHPPRTLGDVT